MNNDEKHWQALSMSNAEGIAYDDARGRIVAREQLDAGTSPDGTPLTNHFRAMLRAQAKGVTQFSANFASVYARELSAEIEEREAAAKREEEKLDALLVQTRAARIAREASAQAQRPALTAIPGGRTTTPAPGRGAATLTVNGTAYRPRANRVQAATLAEALTQGAEVAEGRSESVPAFARCQLGTGLLTLGVAAKLTEHIRARDVVAYRALSLALVNSLTVIDDGPAAAWAVTEGSKQ